MEQFPGNANKDKEKRKPRPDVEKKVEKVITGEATQRKRPLGRRFKDTFLGGEFKAAAHYIGMEVLLPAFRNMLVDGVTKGVERVVYGESTVRRPSSGYGQPRIQYHSPVNRSGGPIANLPDQPGRARRRTAEIEEVILSSRQDAEKVLDMLTDIINQFDVASVADMKELIGLPTAYTDNSWGWYSMHYADIRQIRDGFLLTLPPAEVIK